jgi:hypothetical protein
MEELRENFQVHIFIGRKQINIERTISVNKLDHKHHSSFILCGEAEKKNKAGSYLACSEEKAKLSKTK